jgi:hypothetical protein
MNTLSALVAELDELADGIVQVAVVPLLTSTVPAGPIGINVVVPVELWMGILPTLPPLKLVAVVAVP